MPRYAFFGNPGYGGFVLEELIRHGVDVAAVFHASQSRLHRYRKLYRRYATTRKKRRELRERLRAKLETFRDEPHPVPAFGVDPKGIAAARGLRTFDGAQVHAPETPALLRGLGVDVILVASFGEFLPRRLLEAPRLAAINMHPSLLPRLRGGFPEFAAVQQGEAEAGVTFHLMEERFDAGNLLLQRKLALAPDETTRSLKERLAGLACGAIPELLARVTAGDLAGAPQDPARVTYCRLAADFDRIDGSFTVAQIRRLVNACHDVEEIGRPRVQIAGHEIGVLSCGTDGLPHRAADGVIHFDVVRHQHRLYAGAALAELRTNLGV